MPPQNPNSPDLGDIVDYDEDSDGFDDVECHAEPAERYEPGSTYEYYPVSIGLVVSGRYKVIHKLGHGGFSTVWMAHDLSKKKDVALKFMVSRPGAENEYRMQNEIIRRVKDVSGLVTFIDTFELRRSDGVFQRVLVFPLYGPSIEITGPRMPVKARMGAARQLLTALKGLHDAGIVHRDLNAGAVLWGIAPTGHLDTAAKYRCFGRPKKIALPDDIWQHGERVKPLDFPLNMIQKTVYLGDFSLAMDAGTSVDYKIQTPFRFCAPERYHGFDPSFASDMWSYMCIFGFLYTGQPLFRGGDGDRAMHDWATTLGPMPQHWKGHYKLPGRDSLPKREFLDHWYGPSTQRNPDLSFAARIRQHRPEISDKELQLVLVVLAKVLCFEPSKRLSASKLLLDPDFKTLLATYGC
ncbi:putative serine/threonine-protein kinase clkA [Paramyrothecium foliicola]|nr:putative serine/threonine-protein kinase clkA [Paramyrothecium foliicola]